MKYERVNVKMMVEQIDPYELSGSPDDIINKLNGIKEKYQNQGQIDISAESYGYENGCSEYVVYVIRPQTDEEYNLMVAQKEVEERKGNNERAQALVAKKLSGKKLTKKEIAFLSSIGIALS